MPSSCQTESYLKVAHTSWQPAHIIAMSVHISAYLLLYKYCIWMERRMAGMVEGTPHCANAVDFPEWYDNKRMNGGFCWDLQVIFHKSGEMYISPFVGLCIGRGWLSRNAHSDTTNTFSSYIIYMYISRPPPRRKSLPSYWKLNLIQPPTFHPFLFLLKLKHTSLRLSAASGIRWFDVLWGPRNSDTNKNLFVYNISYFLSQTSFTMDSQIYHFNNPVQVLCYHDSSLLVGFLLMAYAVSNMKRRLSSIYFNFFNIIIYKEREKKDKYKIT